VGRASRSSSGPSVSDLLLELAKRRALKGLGVPLPDGRLHRLASKLFLGREYRDVDLFLDAGYKVFGRAHRRLDPLHSPLGALLYGLISRDPERVKAGLLHLLIDELG
jgi:hypothetical protein